MTKRITENILGYKVSFQENTWTNISFIEPTIGEILNEIKSNKYKYQVSDLRSNFNQGNLDYYNNYKKQLPAVTFSGTFNKNRSKENIKEYNGFIVLDIDKLIPDQIQSCYHQLLKDEFVLSFWRSPSNNGFKGLIQIEYLDISNEIELDTKHKSAFKKLSTYFQNKYFIELDKSGSDISRLCFLSYDPNLVIKKEYKMFQITHEDINFVLQKKIKSESRKIKDFNQKDSLYNPEGRNNRNDRKLMTDIIRYLTMKKLSITFLYSDWCKVGLAIVNTFTYDIGLNYFKKLSMLDEAKYNEIHCINFLKNCYETNNGNVNFASIIYLANEKGFMSKQQKIKEGVPKVEV
ncbi:hypothetical protein EWU23_13265 [Cytophagaceae bacterium 50C-KIRBA]|uniref:BT4734-like N-terminal domain-containing protein n=2 Tax=Aquirufa beregesia TaxID=2516556 RepID=A0ABX0EZF8_9BACT|nr:BT4734/BF3469 family protein [Aquirufa beregesia]NGZ45448.1 hypothetical protein [Aquirufa beregesia]